MCRRTGGPWLSSADDPVPTSAVAGDRRLPDLALGDLQLDLEVRVGQPLGHSVAPLDDRHAVGDVGVEVEIVKLQSTIEPVSVHVRQRRSTDQRRVYPGEDEGR